MERTLLVRWLGPRDKCDLCNGFIKGMDKAARDEFFKKLSNAEKCCEFLNKEDRGLGDVKHQPSKKKPQPSDGKRSLSSRKHFVSNYKRISSKTGDRTAFKNNHVPMEDCKWEVPDSCWKEADKPDWARARDDDDDKVLSIEGVLKMFHPGTSDRTNGFGIIIQAAEQLGRSPATPSDTTSPQGNSQFPLTESKDGGECK